MNAVAVPSGPTHIVLVGGGHAHVEVLRRFRLRPERSVRLSLITSDPETPYSGMIPGHIAGHYARAETVIDVGRLANFTGCTALFCRATGLDADRRCVYLSDGRSIQGDLVSIDVGAVTQMPPSLSPGTLVIAVKPMDAFERHWPLAEQRLRAGADTCVGIVGAGPGGIEVALAIRHRLAPLHPETDARPRIVVLEKSNQILPGFDESVRRRLARILAAHEIEIRLNFGGFEPFAGTTEFDVLISAAGVGPLDWLRQSGLATDHGGFVAVNRHLQSISHPAFFAAGDAAGMMETPRSKSGVIAVRQGPILAENLRRAARALPLKRFAPQKEWLNLISTGDRNAVASWGRWSAEGRWVWYWKNWIDARFIARFQF